MKLYCRHPQGYECEFCRKHTATYSAEYVSELTDRIAALELALAEQRNIAFAAQKEASRCAELERENQRLRGQSS